MYLCKSLEIILPAPEPRSETPEKPAARHLNRPWACWVWMCFSQLSMATLPSSPSPVYPSPTFLHNLLVLLSIVTIADWWNALSLFLLCLCPVFAHLRSIFVLVWKCYLAYIYAYIFRLIFRAKKLLLFMLHIRLKHIQHKPKCMA